MIKLVDQNRFGVVNYIVSSVEDIDNLPTYEEDENGNRIHLIGQGSTAFVINGSLVYMYSEEDGAWHTI